MTLFIGMNSIVPTQIMLSYLIGSSIDFTVSVCRIGHYSKDSKIWSLT